MHTGGILGTGLVFTTALFSRLEQIARLNTNDLRREQIRSAGRIRQAGLGLRRRKG